MEIEQKEGVKAVRKREKKREDSSTQRRLFLQCSERLLKKQPGFAVPVLCFSCVQH